MRVTARDVILALLCKSKGSKGLSFNELANLSGYSKASVSAALRRLLEEGCVEYVDGKYVAHRECCERLHRALR